VGRIIFGEENLEEMGKITDIRENLDLDLRALEK